MKIRIVCVAMLVALVFFPIMGRAQQDLTLATLETPEAQQQPAVARGPLPNPPGVVNIVASAQAGSSQTSVSAPAPPAPTTIKTTEVRQLIVAHEPLGDPRGVDGLEKVLNAIGDVRQDTGNKIVGVIWTLGTRYPDEMTPLLASYNVKAGLWADAPNSSTVIGAYWSDQGQQVSILRDPAFEARTKVNLAAQNPDAASWQIWQMSAALAQEEGNNRLIKVIEGMINRHAEETQVLLNAYKIRVELPDGRRIGYGVP